MSIALLVAPLVAWADVLPDPPANPLQQTLLQLPQACPTLAPGLTPQTQALLQAFYEGQNYQPVWAQEGRLAALQAALPQLADDGLDPLNYPLPEGQDLCADIDTSRQYLQALHDVSTRGVAVAGMWAFALWASAVVCTVAQAAKAAWLAPLQQATGGWFIWLLVALLAVSAGVLTTVSIRGRKRITRNFSESVD